MAGISNYEKTRHWYRICEIPEGMEVFEVYATGIADGEYIADKATAKIVKSNLDAILDAKRTVIDALRHPPFPQIENPDGGDAYLEWTGQLLTGGVGKDEWKRKHPSSFHEPYQSMAERFMEFTSKK